MKKAIKDVLLEVDTPPSDTKSLRYRKERERAASDCGLTLCDCGGILYRVGDCLKCGDCFKTFCV